MLTLWGNMEGVRQESGEPRCVCILIPFLLIWWVDVPMHAVTFPWRSEDNGGTQISPPTMGVLRIELRSVWGLVTSTFITEPSCWPFIAF